MRFAPVFGIGWVGIWLCASPASLQVKPPIEELFRGSEGVRLSVQIDLPQAQLTSEEARDYCLRELTALGVPIVDEKPDDLREADVPLQQRQVK